MTMIRITHWPGRSRLVGHARRLHHAVDSLPRAIRSLAPSLAPARLVPLANLADEKSGLTANRLRVAAIRGRLRAQKSGQGTWLNSKKWAQEDQKNKCSRG